MELNRRKNESSDGRWSVEPTENKVLYLDDD